MQVSVSFCSRCGNQLGQGDGECRACGADAVEANVIAVLKRISARRSPRGRDDDDGEDIIIPI